MKSQLSTDTAAESRSNATTTSHRFVHPDAKELLYLDIKFSSVARMYSPTSLVINIYIVWIGMQDNIFHKVVDILEVCFFGANPNSI
jgi:hypothetical protein